MNWFGPSDEDSPTWIAVSSDEAIAKVTLSVPSGYTLKLDQPAGTRLGNVSPAVLSDVAGTSWAYAEGDVVVDDPARYASDPTAQACAPGSHAAVWSVRLPELGQIFQLPIFVDRQGADGTSGTTLRFCPIWPTPENMGVSATDLSFYLDDVFGTLTAPGRNTWSALVSPPLATLAPDESRTFEVRALEPVPHKVTLRARQVLNKPMVHLRGKVTAAGQPEQGAEVVFGVITESMPAGSVVPHVGPVKTGASGEFSFRHGVRETTKYFASVSVSPRPCTEASTAPAGCISETVSSPPLGPVTIVRVRRPTDARLVVRARDQALARRVSLTLADLPPRWNAYDTFSLLSCRGFRPKLSALTATGHFESRTFERGDASASSRVTVYVSEGQARTAFAREAHLEAARCIADELRKDGYDVQWLRKIPFAALGEHTRAFRIVLPRRSIDLVSFRQGRAVVHLGFSSVGQPLEEGLAAKVAARARRS